MRINTTKLSTACFLIFSLVVNPTFLSAAAPIKAGLALSLPAAVILSNSLRALTSLPRVTESQLSRLETQFGPAWGIRAALANDAALLLSQVEAAKDDSDLRGRLIVWAGGGDEGIRELVRREVFARGLLAEWRAAAAEAPLSQPALVALDELVKQLEAVPAIEVQADALKAVLEGHSAVHDALYGTRAVDVSLPAALRPQADSSAVGKTILLVGAKPEILEQARSTADELKFRLLLADKPEARKKSAGLVAEADFVLVPDLDRHDRNVLHEIAEGVAKYTETAGIGVHGVITFTNRDLLAAGRIRDRLDAEGTSRQTIERAYDKMRARRLVNQRDPRRAVQFHKIESAAEARRAFREMGGSRQHRFVMKANRGDNGQFVALGIKSEEEAERVYRRLRTGLRAAARSGDAGIFDVEPGIMMEEMLEKSPGSHEVSAEMVMKNGQPVLAIVSDTISIGRKGDYPGGSMTFPSQQSEVVQKDFIDVAVAFLTALGFKNGNARVDLIRTPNGARAIEANLRMGGASIWKCVEILTGVNLVRQGFRALLGLQVDPGSKPTETLVYSFIAARYSGEIVAIEGIDEALKLKGVRRLKMTAAIGDKTTEAKDGAFQDLGEIIVTAPTYQKARAWALEALSRIRIAVRRKGKTVWQRGDFLHF